MKIKIGLLTLIMVTGVIFSCEDILDEALPSAPTENQFANNEENFDKIVVAIYQKLQDFYRWRGGAGNWVHGSWLLPDDNLTVTAGGRSSPYENFSDLNTSSNRLADFFNMHYHLIGRANTMIDLQEKFGDDAYVSEELKNAHLGEALFLRGYINLKLYNFWGTAPLNIERINDLADVFLPNSSGTELIDQAIMDLQTASQLLPDQPIREGRVWNESAYGMLGKALMIRGTSTGSGSDFNDALSAFNNVTSRTLVANFEENFLETTENNTESLFEVQVGKNLVLNNVWLSNDNFDVVGDISATYVYFNTQDDPGWITDQTFVPTSSVIPLMDPQDPRTFLSVDSSFASVKKYVTQFSGATTAAANWNNPRILRYADVLLLKAEAIVRSGGALSEAIGLVNQVRERARNMNTTGFPQDLNTGEGDANTVLDWIYNERRIELAFEEDHRWQDMRRRHMAGEISLTNPAYDWGSLQDVNFQEHNLLFPFPNSEILANNSLQQNTGY